ncbi:MAG: hypothetical protein WBB42_07260 [Polyangiales bacterium]
MHAKKKTWLAINAVGGAAVLALLGLLLFAVQTAFLDPLVWPQFF